MLKSTSHKANSNAGVATGADIGREVNVVGIGTGRLRYVGGIHDKDGLFCGVELDEPNGKHDGSFQGVSYFICQPGHGIFAPIYKVELTSSPALTTSKTFIRPQEQKLSRSAIPALQLKHIFAPAASPSPMSTSTSTSLNTSTGSTTNSSMGEGVVRNRLDPLSASQMSTTSSLFNNSFILDGSWTMDDAMCMSNDTFIIPGNPLAHEFTLMDVEKPASILPALDALNNLGESQVLEESRIGVEYLPVVEDEDDEPETPLVTVKSILAQNGNPPLPSSTTASLSPRTTSATTSTERPLSQTSVDTGYHGESDAATSPTLKDQVVDETTTVKETSAAEAKTPLATTPRKMTSKTPAKAPPPPPPPREPRVKKEPAPPPPPKFPVKPKAPSKHQLMMQKLAESIAADKLKPKKEVKARVSLLPPTPEKSNESTDENERMKAVTATPAAGGGVVDSPKRRRADAAPLKALNAGPVSKTSSTAASKESVNSTAPKEPREPRKPRVSLLPPPKDAAPKPAAVKEATATSTASKKTATATTTTATTNGKLKQTNFPTSSFAPKVGTPRTPASSVGSTTAAKTATSTKNQADSERLLRLYRASRAVDVMALVCELTQKQRDHLAGQLVHATDEIGEKFAYIEDLKRQLDEVHREALRSARENRDQVDEVQRRHEERLAELKALYEKKLLAAEEEAKRNLEETEQRHEQQVEALTRRHQSACAALDEKIAEAERQVDKLAADKAKLQQALANDKDTKVQTLTAEISSLNTAMSLKSAEMKELRHQLAKLQILIPAKDIEITKLKHKLKEFKAVVDQKRDTEKALVNENEELRKHLRSFSQMNESMKKEVDVLRYHMEELSDADTSSTTPGRIESNSSRESRDSTLFFTPSATLPVRGRHGVTEVARPFSAVMPKTSQSDPMARSLELDGENALSRSALATFRESARAHNHAASEDVIYAPEETIVTHNNVAKKLSFDDDAEDSLEDLPDPQQEPSAAPDTATTDSGIAV